MIYVLLFITFFLSYKKIHKNWFKLQANAVFGLVRTSNSTNLVIQKPHPPMYENPFNMSFKDYTWPDWQNFSFNTLDIIYDIWYVKYSIILTTEEEVWGVGDILTLYEGQWLAYWLRDRSTSAHWITGYPETTATLYAVAKRKICCSCLELNPDS
jgi:hypothetical protein